MEYTINRDPFSSDVSYPSYSLDEVKGVIEPSLSTAMEALCINLQTFMKYIDYHEKKDGKDFVFGITSNTPTIASSWSNSSMSNLSDANRSPPVTHFENESIEEEEIYLTESEFKELEEIYYNPILYLSNTLKHLRTNNQDGSFPQPHIIRGKPKRRF